MGKGKKKSFKFQSYLDKAVAIAADVSSLVVQLKDKPGTADFIAVGAKALETYKRITTKTAESCFEGWEKFPVDPIQQALIELLKDNNLLNYLELHQSGHSKAAVSTINGIDYGWVIGEHEYDTFGPWTDCDDIEKAKHNLARFIWETLGSAIKIKATVINYRANIKILSDSLTDSLKSDTAEEIYKDQKRFLDKNYSRTVMLYGQPGTGKSHIMRHIAQLAGGFSLRISGDSIFWINNIPNLIKFLCPSAILVDDIDRHGSLQNLLTELEEIRIPGQLFLSSANSLSKFDSAVLRPGRFDDIIEVDKLDDAVIAKLLEGVNEEDAEKLRKLPIAYIDDFRRNVNVLGIDKAAENAIKLFNRLKLVYSLTDAGKAEAAEKETEKQPTEEPTNE